VALIYDLLCETTKVKSLKLMSANITDDGASILFKVCPHSSRPSPGIAPSIHSI
jgi:hypothetical protein